MKIKQLCQSQLIAMICLSLLTSISFAQQPFESTPENPTQVPDDVTGSETPLIQPLQDDEPRRAFETPLDRDLGQGQAVVLNSKYAGWQEASANANRISDNLRANWIMVDTNGRFEGTVVPGEGADVTNLNVFLMHMGRLVKQTTVTPQGRFEFTNVRQGAYSLIGWGEKGFFAFGFNILAYNPQVADSASNTIRVTAFQNATTINTDWIQYYASRITYRVYGRYETGEGRDDPASLYGVEGLVRNFPSAVSATSLTSLPVSNTSDGRLIGRVHQMNTLSGRPVDVRTTKVMLFKGDNVVASTTTDNFGVFEFRQVPDGSYGLVAAGVDGVGLIGITVAGSSGDGTPADFTMISSETIGWLNHYATEVAYRRSLLAPRPQQMEEQPYGTCPNCGNAPGGCMTCRSAYANSCCRSRGISFEQWAAMGCQCSARKFGDGSILAEVTRQLRKNIEKSDAVLERAFYPNEFEGGYSNQPNYGQPMYNQPYNGN